MLLKKYPNDGVSDQDVAVLTSLVLYVPRRNKRYFLKVLLLGLLHLWPLFAHYNLHFHATRLRRLNLLNVHCIV